MHRDGSLKLSLGVTADAIKSEPGRLLEYSAIIIIINVNANSNSGVEPVKLTTAVHEMVSPEQA